MGASSVQSHQVFGLGGGLVLIMRPVTRENGGLQSAQRGAAKGGRERGGLWLQMSKVICSAI